MKKLFIICISLFMFASCSDLLEEDLREKTVILNTPMDMDSLTNYSVGFWWNELDGAESYKMQLVTGSFDFPTALILDSTVSTNVFDLTLTPGAYEWQVRGLNNSTETEYSRSSFVIVANQDLGQDQIILISPIDGAFFNQNDLTLSWFLNTKAEDYLVDVSENGSLVLPTIVTTDDFADLSLNEGEYVWSIQGRNPTSISIASARSFTIDTTAPSQPLLLSPANNEIEDTTVINFSWQQGSSLSPVNDTLFIYSDSLLTTQDQYLPLSDFQEVSLPGMGIYFWRVRSVDLAGNSSTYSSIRKLTIN